MQQTLRPSALVPLGFVVENATHDGAITVITVRRPTRTGALSGMRDDFGADPQSLSPPRRGLAPGGSAGSPRRRGAPFPLRG
jgi:hypothetical protein